MKKKINGSKPEPIRRCANPKCNCILRSGNTKTLCATCDRKAKLKNTGLSALSYLLEDDVPKSSL